MAAAEGGFTAIEALVVMTISAMLFAFASPMMSDVTAALDTKRETRDESLLIGKWQTDLTEYDRSWDGSTIGGAAGKDESKIPTLGGVAESHAPMAADFSGWCVAVGRKIPAYSDRGRAAPTTAPEDPVLSVGETEDDPTNC